MEVVVHEHEAANQYSCSVRPLGEEVDENRLGVVGFNDVTTMGGPLGHMVRNAGDDGPSSSRHRRIMPTHCRHFKIRAKFHRK